MAAAPLQGSPVSPAKWSSLNSYNMLKAKSLTANMLLQVRTNEEGERASKDAGMEQAAREKQQLKDAVFAKAAAHGNIIRTSSDCVWNIEDGVLNTDNSVSLLKQNRALGFASLQVCKRRTQLRSRRPGPEQIKDYVAIALDSEQKLLEAARDEYLQLEAEGKKISEALTSMRNFLSADTGSRRLVMKKDAQTLRPHLAPPPEMQRPAPDIKESDSRTLLEDTFNLLDRSNKHREKTIEVVARIKEDSRTAVVRTESCLEKRTDELNALEKELKKHMTECEAAISVSQRSLEKSTKRLDPTDASKKEKLKRDMALLDQLKGHKDKLHHEIQNKFIALEIDNMCRRVTPVKACEPSLLDAQNAATAGSSRNTSAGQLSGSASAPNLFSTVGSGLTGGKLPSLGGTTDSFKFGGTSPKLTSAGSMTSSASSGGLGMVKVKK